MQELNEKELETVVGGTHSSSFGYTGGAAGGFAGGSKNATSNSGSTSTIQPTLIQTGSSNYSSANGHDSFAAGGASSFAGGATGTH